MKKEATSECKGLKRKTSEKKKRQPRNARGSKEKTTMKKEAVPQTKNQEPLAHGSQLH
jgi:hypothetical protein